MFACELELGDGQPRSLALADLQDNGPILGDAVGIYDLNLAKESGDS
jgi:hypothetical protein